jgi:lipopolysaccharide heptosyltransferase II
MNSKKWQEADSILCIRLDSLGDVLMSTPAFRALKETRPDRSITLLTSQSGASIARLIPEVANTITYDPPWMKASQLPIGNRSEFEMIGRLQRCGFDAAVIFTTFSQSPLPAAFMAHMAGIPLRLAHCRENPYHLLTNWVHETDHLGQAGIRHEVRRQLDLVASVGSRTTNEQLSLTIFPPVFEKVRQRLEQIHLDVKRPWIVVHPGSTAPSRRYPARSFGRMAQILCREHGFQIVFTGTEPEVELIESIRMMQSDSFSLAGKLDIEEFSALIALAPLLVSNNTGPVHMAAALGTPVVDLYALTNPQHTPWQVPHRTLFYDVPCKFCYKSICPLGHHDCLQRVSSESVVMAVIDLLAETRQAEVGLNDTWPV